MFIEDLLCSEYVDGYCFLCGKIVVLLVVGE